MLSCPRSFLGNFDFSSCVEFSNFKFGTGEQITPTMQDILFPIVSSQKWTVAGMNGWGKKMKRWKGRRMRERWEGGGARWKKRER